MIFEEVIDKPIWLSNKKSRMYVWLIRGETLTEEDLLKLAVQQDEEENILSFSAQKVSKDKFEELTKVRFAQEHNFIIYRVFKVKNKDNWESVEIPENPDKVKIKIFKVSKQNKRNVN